MVTQGGHLPLDRCQSRLSGFRQLLRQSLLGEMLFGSVRCDGLGYGCNSWSQACPGAIEAVAALAKALVH